MKKYECCEIPCLHHIRIYWEKRKEALNELFIVLMKFPNSAKREIIGYKIFCILPDFLLALILAGKT